MRATRHKQNAARGGEQALHSLPHLRAAHAGHVDVGKHGLDFQGAITGDRHRIFAVSCGNGVIPKRFEELADHAAYQFLIIDNKD
jgi:hypothetical protein